jgi:glycosyltransferase involved in cell wall biosynthesis
VVIGLFRRCKVVYWVMDLNPDQMIALGLITERSLRARVFRAFNRAILRRADDVVVLDRFMAERVLKLADVGTKMSVMPPWPHEEALESIDHLHNPFRQRHGLEGKFVVMYSGNHSPANPITTVLDAAERLQGDERLLFLFIGGGTGKREVEERVAAGVKNIRSLPYQPLSEIKYSLSAGDVHIVTIGDGVVGIVHPCKVYGAMAVARPILLVGPDVSHVSDLIDRHAMGRHVRHGDVEGCVRAITELAGAPPTELSIMGRRAGEVVATQLSKKQLCGRFCDVLQRALPAPVRG